MKRATGKKPGYSPLAAGIRRWQKERERIFLAWYGGKIGRDAARDRIGALTRRIERLGLEQESQ